MNERPAPGWFNPVATFLGRAYLRNAFAMGTEQEVTFLVERLHLGPESRVLDVGCGPGRHALALAERGIEVHGIDLSDDFLRIAQADAVERDLPATFELMDVRELSFDGEFDAAVCLCQGGFGLLGGVDDEEAFGRIARSVRPGGSVAVTAFSAYFALKGLEEDETFDVSTGVIHEHTMLKNLDGDEQPAQLWTTCFTARELRLLAGASGLEVNGVYGVAPGRYGLGAPTLEHPELLLLAHRAASR